MFRYTGRGCSYESDDLVPDAMAIFPSDPQLFSIRETIAIAAIFRQMDTWWTYLLKTICNAMNVRRF